MTRAPAPSRDARLAAALRANLRRRKAASTPAEPEPPSEPDEAPRLPDGAQDG